jgi:hypothetical protein
MRDPLHQQILDGLGEELNPQTFEDCACDLLRDEYPTLAPVRGGHDAGMDGAVADGEGEAFPLICTTREDFHRNFEESLDSFLEHERRPRKVVFATSRVVTPEKRRRLEDAARERGFTLLQVVDRHGMAQRLYWSPRWLQDLLGLSAVPSALSAAPRSRRPLLDLQPVGREEELERIRSTSGDLVLVGEPGSGKTFLFAHLIREGWNGLFLVDEDRGEVKKALLEQRPAVVIVDDAHLRGKALGMLRHLRDEMGADFSLIATTWTWERDLEAVSAALPGAEVRKLPLLPRHQILEIFQQAGVRGSGDLLRELVNQAANKPGLAATIAHLWKLGAWQEILEGKALHRDILAAFGGSATEVEDLLACFSLGGDRGMGLEPVRLYLGLTRPEIRRQAAALAAGGVVSEEKDDALSVWPRRLRTSLLRTVSFSDRATGLDYRPLLEVAPNFVQAVQEIAAVAQAGARVPAIRELVLQAGYEEESAKSAWRLLARTSEEQARWVLENYPGDLLEVAHALLEEIPSIVIPRLLERAAAEARLRVRESRSMSLLSSWVQELYPFPPDEALHRRELVARAAKRFLATGGNVGTGVHAICVAIRPTQKGSSRDPGLGQTVTLWSALLPGTALRRIRDLWAEVKDAIPELDREALQRLESVLWDWMYPPRAARGAAVPEEVARGMPAFALQVLQQVAPLARTSPGVGARLARLAARLGATLPVKLDSVFELLYPESYGETEPARKAEHQEALRLLASEWVQDPPGAIQRLAGYEKEAERIGYSWPRGSLEICRLLAEQAADPRPFLELLVEREMHGALVAPFLERLVREQSKGWEEVAERCLRLERYQFAAIDAVLTLPDAPSALVDMVLDQAAEWPQSIETLAHCREMPGDHLRAALRHPRWEVALAAAIGEWHASEKSGVPGDLLADWRAAILRAPADESRVGAQFWLGVVLGQEPKLALEWLLTRLRDPDLPTYFLDGPFGTAIDALHPEHRTELVAELPAVSLLDSLLPRLVGRDAGLYRQLLGRSQLRDYHLVPLSGKPDEAWTNLAVLALDAGYAPEGIAEATIRGSGTHFYAGPGVDYWEGWARAFAALEGDPRAEIREVGRQGRKIVEHDLERARARREEIALRGL